MLCLKQATKSTFLVVLVDKGTLFQSLEADTANVRPPSVSLLYLGQIALKLAYRVFRKRRE